MTQRLAPMWHVLGSQAALAVSVLALGVVSVRSAVPAGVAVVAGTAAGTALAIGLGSRPGLPRALSRDRLRSLVGAGAILTVGAAAEEVIWRGLALGLLSDRIGTIAAFAASTIGFALVHLEPRAVLAHVPTGAAFGAVFLTTGSLAAAILAHAAYNVTVLLAVETRRSARPATAGAQVPPGPHETVIDARGVTKRYGRIEALRGFDLEVRAGEVVALLGPNGAGKTTAIQVLLGLRRPDSGTVRVLGRCPGDRRSRCRIGVTLQEASCPHTVRVREIVAFVAAHFGEPTSVEDTIDRFGLRDVARRQVGGLSGGQRRRLALALAFVGRPDLIFLDEPTTGLDVETRREVWAAVGAFAATGGTVLLTTHSLDEAERLASRVVVMRNGRVAASGTPHELRAEAGATSLEDAFLHLTEGDG